MYCNNKFISNAVIIYQLYIVGPILTVLLKYCGFVINQQQRIAGFIITVHMIVDTSILKKNIDWVRRWEIQLEGMAALVLH